MLLQSFLCTNLEKFQASFRAWFLSSDLDKSIAIASSCKLTLSLLYGSIKRKDLVTFAATDGASFLEHLRLHRVGFLMVVEDLDDMSGDDLIQEALVVQPNLRSILLVESHVILRQPLKVYESDVVIATSDMLKADFVFRAGVLAAVGGARYRSPSIASLPRGVGIELTATERKILEFYAAGLTLDEMTDRLPYTKNTVKTYSRNLMQKLGVGNRQKALSAAIALGLSSLLPKKDSV